MTRKKLARLAECLESAGYEIRDLKELGRDNAWSIEISALEPSAAAETADPEKFLSYMAQFDPFAREALNARRKREQLKARKSPQNNAVGGKSAV